MQQGDAKVQHGVFIHVGALGDLLVSTAALYETLEKFPDTPFIIYGSPLWRQILDPKIWPRIQAIHTFDKGRTSQGFERTDAGWKEIEPKSLWQLCKNAKVTINLRFESFRFAWAPWLRQVPERLGSAPSPYQFLYTKNAPWLGKDPLVHERDAKLRLVDRDLMTKWRGRGLPQLKLPNPATLEAQSVQPKSYILINPTASRREKAWPSKNFGEIARHLRARREKVIVIGAPNETDWLLEVTENDFTLVQPANISELCDWVWGAKVLLTNASSVQFLAASFETPVLTLMGRSKPEIWGPLGPRSSYLVGSVDPGLDSKIFEQEQAAFCTISVDSVMRSLEKTLGAT